ncbi:conjugative transfer ATPase [uncultured Pseudoteredinibacter sp.]|uniref:conjugative transfer ATPase n=1 Tax=uncultured Pseudoteredinibacter sp. TaxID=1641701 RepID=UPI0026313A2B|nr:conjugative transfer ATPase [uncultured Pseudoteredinibacter sp.]
MSKHSKTQPITNKDTQRLYQQSASIVDWLPWIDYESDSRTFTLEDGFSAGAMFEVSALSTEARTEAFLEEVRENIQTCLNHAIPSLDNPFVLQCFVSDEPHLGELAEALKAYPEQQGRTGSHDKLKEDFHERMQAHFRKLCENPIEDSAVSGGHWQGRDRKIRVFLYRRRPLNDDQKQTPPEELNQVVEQWSTQMAASGLSVRRCDDQDLYQWMFHWFNPDYSDSDRNSESSPPPIAETHEEKPFGFDLSEQLFLSQAESDNHGNWWFGQKPHRAITVDSLKRKPVPGHITGERLIGDNLYAVFDRLPPNSILSFTITIQPQDRIENHVVQVRNASKGETSEAIAAQHDAEEALTHMSKGDYLFPVSTTLFLRGDNKSQLDQYVSDANALLLANGLHPVRVKDELLSIDNYIRQLPMNYEPARDKIARRSRLMFSSDIACLLPFYGRSRGTKNPGFVFYNRGGEPVCFDPLNKLDRSKNAFGLVLGPPGSGKSALMVYILMQVVAIYGARIYIVDKGGSFKLFGDYCEHFGLNVNHIRLSPSEDISLPPFADAIAAFKKESKEQSTQDSKDSEHDATDSDLEGRDLLGEMELKARIMITGGAPEEEALLTRADRLVIRQAILKAAELKLNQTSEPRAKQTAESQVISSDVEGALRLLSDDEGLTANRRERIKAMADAMALYCSGTAGHFFNRVGEAWPEADITILDMDLLANEGYEDQLALGFMGLMNQINSVVDREQYSDRPTFVLADEAHLITTNPLLSIYLVKIVKMWRKLGAWLWLATQNLEDFPDESKKLLNMFEWWIAMVCPKQEIEQISRFKDLNPEQQSLLQATRKHPGNYTEGVVISDNLQCLFRNIPPQISLYLAMTEKHEKKTRFQLMRKFNCSELEAIYHLLSRFEI